MQYALSPCSVIATEEVRQLFVRIKETLPLIVQDLYSFKIEAGYGVITLADEAPHSTQLRVTWNHVMKVFMFYQTYKVQWMQMHIPSPGPDLVEPVWAEKGDIVRAAEHVRQYVRLVPQAPTLSAHLGLPLGHDSGYLMRANAVGPGSPTTAAALAPWKTEE